MYKSEVFSLRIEKENGKTSSGILYAIMRALPQREQLQVELAQRSSNRMTRRNESYYYEMKV